MRELWLYLRERRRTLLCSALCCVIFLAVFAMYRLPPGIVVYPALLCAALGGLFALADFLKWRRRRRELRCLVQRGSPELVELPVPLGGVEEDYQRLVLALRRESQDLKEDYAARIRDMEDYYTAWVHQIKTPISSMALSLQGEDTSQGRKLRLDLFHIEQYVDMVLAYLRLESPSGDYVFRTQGLDRILRETVKKLAPEFISRRLSLTYEPIDLEVVTDEKWLSFVLEQILTNALKYTREGGITIDLEEPKTLCIRDTGIGIAPEDLPLIFQRGYTGKNGRLDQRASGLGLYLCREICSKLGIGLSAASVVGEGTVIRLDLGQYQLKQE